MKDRGRKKSIMNNKQYELIGESIWDIYKSLAQILERKNLDPKGMAFKDHPADRRRVGESSIVGALAVGGAQHLGKEAAAKVIDIIQKRRTKKKRKEEEDTPLGESIWTTYKNLGHIISEVLKTPKAHLKSVTGMTPQELENARFDAHVRRHQGPVVSLNPSIEPGGPPAKPEQDWRKAAKKYASGKDLESTRARRLAALEKGTTGIRGAARRVRGQIQGLVLDPDKNPEARTKRTGAGLPERSRIIPK
jgi:hypothetical protein